MEPLGHGSMGEVFLAFDRVLARNVAVKFVAAHGPSVALRERLLVEARAAARLNHPNVVAVFRVGEYDGHPYLVSEFVPGQSLDALPKPVPGAQAQKLGLDLARGLAAAHRQGILHRDIKPANAILADDGEAKLLDFGLAKLVEARREGRRETAPAPGAPIVLARPDVIGPQTAAPQRSSAMTLPPADEAVLGGVTNTALPSPRRHRTREGARIGTPDYMAPELWRGEPASRRSDVYALGAVLYELVAGRAPFGHVAEDLLEAAVQTTGPLPLADVAPAVDRRFAELVDRCLCSDAARRFAGGEELRAALESLARESSSAPAPPAGNPYRGLRVFDGEHRAVFFGRSLETSAVLDRLRGDPFVLVTGESGVGKSSLCRAGVLPLVEAGLGGGRNWRTVSLFPGRQPVAALAAALATFFEGDEPALVRTLRSDPGAALASLSRGLGADRGLLLFVDQLEELVSLSDPSDAAVAEELLSRLAAGLPGLKLLATVRADLVSRLAALPSIGDGLGRALYFLRPLARPGIREAIVEPAQTSGIRFESDALIDLLVNEASTAPGGLPLLQFTLAQLWEARDDGRSIITSASLEALGGVGGALARHADAVIEALLPAQRLAARRLLTRLVTADETRARRTEQELTGGDAIARASLSALVHARLVLAHEGGADSVFALAHEVLITGWHTLSEWLLDDAELRLLRERLNAAVTEWERLGGAPEGLWRAKQLAESTELHPEALTPRERDFLLLSRQRLRRRKWRRNGLIASGLGLTFALWGAFELAANASLTAQVSQRLDVARQALAVGRRAYEEATAFRAQAYEQFDARQRALGETTWEAVRARDARAGRHYTRATQALEAALVLAPQRDDVRALFAEVLHQRATMAWDERQREKAEELVQRLSLHDVTGKLDESWRAPGLVSVQTTPPGAALSAQKFVGGRWSAPVPLKLSPLVSQPLPPGSYRLRLTMPGRPVVLYPLLVERGSRALVVVELPAAAAIPAGFVFVPPGRFFFGSGAEDRLRRTYHDAVPLHETRTDAYLIGRTEVTIGQWLEYLESLPPPARRRRAPRVSGTAFSNELVLRELGASRWELAFGPAGHRHMVRTGEKLRYRGRKARVEQDWTRLPVTGISIEDAQAYASWLRATRRVPGARLCTEHEWERAARGADTRDFPHGEELSNDDANYDETYGKDPGAMGPDEVGSHPASRSPFDIDDLAGNAFEWVSSSLLAGGYAARGGSYMHDATALLVANRNTPVTTYRDASIGLRLCASFPAR